MSSPVLTVPPPRDDDHDDVAWALRAASAQWRRDATADAIGWVKRAAETAEEIGNFDRAAELNRLATQLSGGPVAVAPPPPPGARGSIVDIEVEMEEAEFIDDVEELDDVDEVDDVEEVMDVSGDDDIVFDDVEPSQEPRAPDVSMNNFALNTGSSAPPPPSMRPEAPAPPAAAFPRDTRSRPRRPTTASGVDLPPSMRPDPSGIDLADEPDDEEEFGELEFQDEAPTNRVSLSSAPPAPDLGSVRLDIPSRLPLERSTAAEYATSREPRPPQDHEEIERELGVNLSLRVSGPSSESEELAPVPSAPRPPGYEGSPPYVASAAASFGQSRAHEPPPSSVEPPLGAYEDPFGSAVSPVPGRASVRPSSPPGQVPRITSAESEPYGLAPSAEMPPAEQRPQTPIEPPSRPSTAPPPEEMSEPEERPSRLPPVRPTGYPSGHPSAPPAAPALSSAPDADELDEMFAKISRPPPKPSAPRAVVAPADQAPPPPDLGAPAVSGQEVAKPPEDDAILVDGIDLMEIQGLQDLPDDSALALARSARIITLQPGEEVSSFGVALVTNGAVQLMPTVADATCAIARKGEVLFTKGTLDSEVAVRVVGYDPGSRVALFTKEALDAATSSCPWVGDELAEVADKYLAFAGGVLGPLGDSLDDMFRFMVLDKCEVKSKAPGTMIALAGKSMDGMYILGGGSLEILDSDGFVSEELGMGDFVFPETVLSATPAAASVRVGKDGALVLYANRMSAHELLATCPPFIELLAG